VPLLNFRLSRPAALIDVNRIAPLAYVREDNGTVALGAMTRQRTIEFSPLVARRLPLLTEATRWVGHLPIRSRGTIGGSIAHADPSAEYPAVLTALEGEVVAQGPRGQRTLKAGELFETYLTTRLAADELLIEVRLPAMPAGCGYAFEEFARRHGDFAIIGIAAMIVRDGAGARQRGWRRPAPARCRCACARPRQFSSATGLANAAIQAAAARAAELVTPDGDVHATSEYRRHLTGVLTARALKRAVERAR
jgi:CO/xanthine dehydrogenase FAD-binding subunit